MTNQKATRQQWQQRIESCHDSGLSLNAWCRQNGVKPSTGQQLNWLLDGYDISLMHAEMHWIT